MAEINRKKFKIFSLNANRALAQEIADRIGVPLSDLTVQTDLLMERYKLILMKQFVDTMYSWFNQHMIQLTRI